MLPTVKKHLFWFRFQPADEREQQLYLRAYQRSYQSLVTLLIVFFAVLPLLKDVFPLVNGRYGLELAVIVLVAISYIYGSFIFRGEELQLVKKYKLTKTV